MTETAYMRGDVGVYIILVNWNGWGDTIECLESVFRNNHPSYRVIICDNSSADLSMSHIKLWAEGLLDSFVPQANTLRHLSFPPVAKPISYAEYDRLSAELGGDLNDVSNQLILIRTGGNWGFAGGNNIGLRYAKARGDFKYIWLLNNDTVVLPDTLLELIRRMERRSDAGMCGSVLCYYDAPDTIQAVGGGKFNRWTGTVSHYLTEHRREQFIDLFLAERSIDYIMGSSMLITQQFLEDIGLMSEEYFLFYEEYDWLLRAKGTYGNCIAPASIVYHKGGSSIRRTDNSNNLTGFYYDLRNRLIFSRKFFPDFVPFVYFRIIITLLGKCLRCQFEHAKTILKALKDSSRQNLMNNSLALHQMRQKFNWLYQKNLAPNKKVIAIDGRVLMSAPAGIANYLINAINELSRQLPAWSFIILTNRDINPECFKLLAEADNIRHIKKRFTNIGILWYTIKLYHILKVLKPDYFWAPANSLPPFVPKGIKTMLTVHDLVSKDFRQTMTMVNRIYNDRHFNKSIANADIIWAVSNFTKVELEKRYPKRKCEDIFVGSAVDRSVFRPAKIFDVERKELLDRMGVGEKFLLYAGTVEPRKNIAFLLSLMPVLVREGYWLLIVGSKGWGKTNFSQILNSAGYPRDRVVFAGFLESDKLIKLYNCATVFISTSLNEGFSLPHLEAMNCGCPVVSPHNSAMIELVQGAGLTVKGWEVDDWCAAVRDVTTNREKYVKQGFARALRYDWQEIVNKFRERL